MILLLKMLIRVLILKEFPSYSKRWAMRGGSRNQLYHLFIYYEYTYISIFIYTYFINYIYENKTRRRWDIVTSWSKIIYIFLQGNYESNILKINEIENSRKLTDDILNNFSGAVEEKRCMYMYICTDIHVYTYVNRYRNIYLFIYVHIKVHN